MFTSIGEKIQLNETLNVRVWINDGISFVVEVPKGFVSDGASIPRALWPILGPPIGARHLKPSIVHDLLCVQARTYQERLLGDAVFFKLLTEAGVPAWKRTVMYCGVRAFARVSWGTEWWCKAIRKTLGIKARGDAK